MSADEEPNINALLLEQEHTELVRERLAGSMTTAKGKRRRYQGPYGADIVAKVLRYRMQGLGMDKIAERQGMPSVPTLMRWRQEHPEFEETWRGCFDDWVEREAEGTVALADSAWDGTHELDGRRVVGIYNSIKTRQWLVSKRIAHRYGDKVEGTADQVVLQPQEIEVTTGSQGKGAAAAAKLYAETGQTVDGEQALDAEEQEDATLDT